MDTYNDTPVGHDDFNPRNDIAIFKGPLPELYESIPREGLKALIDSKADIVLLCVQAEEDYRKAHICGAVNIPAGVIERDAPGAIRADSHIVVYGRDSTSLEGAVAVDKLKTLGYRSVVIYRGGIAEWISSGFCVEGDGVQKAREAA